jgi:ribosomal silencing factor RsfS
MAIVTKLNSAIEANERVPLSDDEMREEKELIQKKKDALTELLRRECIGKYKLEVMFSSKRSINNPTAGVISIWESGSKLHGGGDSKIYFCPGKGRRMNNCQAIIPFDNVNYGHALCPRCGLVWKGEELDGEVFGRWTMQGWARKLADYFIDCGSNADVYVKQPKMDIREAARQEQEKQMKGDKLNVVRSGLIRYIYPLARILQDTQGGSDVADRFYAFLRS